MASKPFVFIGSSAEGLDYAKAIQVNLDYPCESQIWHQGLFGLSDGTLETLVKNLHSFDYAILVITGDDLTISRGVGKNSPRDNVIFELGLFIGGLGRERVFMVVDRSAQLKLPSDLGGITPATFTPPVKGNNQSALGAACTQIEVKIKELGLREEKSPDKLKYNTDDDLKEILTYLQTKKLTMISFEGLIKHVNPRLTKDYVIEIISKNLTRVTRTKLKGNKEGIKILTNPNVRLNERMPTAIKDSIIKHQRDLLAESELERLVSSLISVDYGFQTLEDIREATSLGQKRITDVLNHLVAYGFSEKGVGFDGKDNWRLRKRPIRIISATYQWPSGEVNVIDSIIRLVGTGVTRGIVDPKTFGIGDPIFGVRKFLHLDYIIYGEKKSVDYGDGDTFNII